MVRPEWYVIYNLFNKWRWISKEIFNNSTEDNLSGIIDTIYPRESLLKLL